MPRRVPPASASVAHSGPGKKMSAPAAERNTDALCDLLAQFAPSVGTALEIASGTGQHIVRFAKVCNGLQWQPTDVDPKRLSSINAYAADARCANLAPAVILDATAPGWRAQHPDQSLIVLVNLLHLISETEAKTLIAEAASALAPGGVFIIYGPFMRSGELTSDGDRSFHASLQAQDSEIGYKDDFETLETAFATGLHLRDVIEMPANNLVLVMFRPA